MYVFSSFNSIHGVYLKLQRLNLISKHQQLEGISAVYFLLLKIDFKNVKVLFFGGGYKGTEDWHPAPHSVSLFWVVWALTVTQCLESEVEVENVAINSAKAKTSVAILVKMKDCLLLSTPYFC